MPNGKPGDHPYTDIVHHRRPVYSPAIDDLVRDVVALSDTRAREELAQMLLSEYNEFANPDLSRLHDVLVRLREERRADAVRRGWEV